MGVTVARRRALWAGACAAALAIGGGGGGGVWAAKPKRPGRAGETAGGGGAGKGGGAAAAGAGKARDMGDGPVPTAGEGLVQKVGEAEIDWQRGFVVARAGAAADIRLPGPKAARPEAERRARARALQLLRAAAADLAVGNGRKLAKADIERAAAAPKTLRVEYQSNGGVLLDLGLDFATLAGAPSVDDQHESKDAPGHEKQHPEIAPLVLEVPAARLELQPTLVAGGKETRAAFAVYRLGAPPADERAIAVKLDKQGRLVLPDGAVAGGTKALTGRRLLIYTRAITK